MKITYPDDTRTLHHHYQGQSQAQSVYVELDPEADPPTLSIDWDGEIGNATPMDVWHGRKMRYGLPAIPTTESAAALLDEIKPLAERVVAGYESEWDGSNFVGRLTEDASEASAEIEDRVWTRGGDDLQIWDACQWIQSAGLVVTTWWELVSECGTDSAATIASTLESEAWAEHQIHLTGTEEYLDALREAALDTD